MICVYGLSRRMKIYDAFLTVIEVLGLSVGSYCITCSFLHLPNLLHLEACASLHTSMSTYTPSQVISIGDRQQTHLPGAPGIEAMLAIKANHVC